MLLPRSRCLPAVVALVATHLRPAGLAAALASVAAQRRPPDLLVVVDDGPPEQQGVSRACLEAVALPADRKVHLHNRRTPGAAGAWNSGLDEIARRFRDPRAAFVAVLDDDDRWLPEHLGSCIEAACSRGLDMVAAGLLRLDDAHPEGLPLSIPAALDADVALVGNPHIQGSNFFIRLAKLLEAGLFDEALTSTTDRDLLIRLADLGSVRFGGVERWTVRHDAMGQRPRLSTPASPRKIQGLREFFRKHRSRMKPEHEAAFRTRARTLFQCFDLESPPTGVPPPSPPAIGGVEGDPLTLVVGITADGDSAGKDRVRPLLEDLLTLQRDPEIASLSVVLLENGAASEGRPLQAEAERLRTMGLDLYFVAIEAWARDAANGLFGSAFGRPEGRCPIGATRTMVQRYVYELASQRPGSVAWILDDDKRLLPLVLTPDGKLRRQPWPMVPVLRALRERGIPIAFGTDTGAAPLPAMTTLRVQLVDLVAHLAALRTLCPDASWPDRGGETLQQRRALIDGYYDLSRRHTTHLEQPWWLPPSQPGESARSVFLRIAREAPRISAGEQVFRPLAFDEATHNTLTPSVFRGGSTFVFELEALRDVPNSVPDVDGRETRRSDMIWSTLNLHCHGRAAVQAPLPVFHDRSGEPAMGLDLARCVDDLRGHAIFRALDELLRRRARLGQDDLVFSGEEVSLATHRYQEYLRERAAALRLSLHRARGAARSALSFLRDPSAWWNTERGHQAVVDVLANTLATLVETLSPRGIERLLELVATPSSAQVAEWLGRLSSTVRPQTPSAAAASGVLSRGRLVNARALLDRVFGARAWQLLGSGAEGTAWTDGARAYKCIDFWRSGHPAAQRSWLQGQVGRWRGTRGLLPVLDVRIDGPRTTIVTPYAPSDPYRGGKTEGLLQLLRECRTHGVICRNIHPDNLRVMGEDVQLIDYGADLGPWNEADWWQMLRRAWLSWRWPHLPNLKERMRASLREEIPELAGWELLRQALDTPTQEEVLDSSLLDAILAEPPRRILDFGAGKCRKAHALAERGLEVVAYDPFGLREGRGVRLTYATSREEALALAPFDAVLCSLVLCTLTGPAYGQALSDLRAAVRDGGCVHLALCNPFFTYAAGTPLQRRHLPDGANLERVFAWEKTLRASGSRRRDVHRPFVQLQRDLLRAGFSVESLSHTPSVDTTRLEPSSDFLVARLRAVPTSPDVSLLIKACAQDWRTLKVQVTHLIEQLEGPSVFRERVLAIDGRTAALTRPYDTPDLEALRREARQLVEDGTLSRVLDVEPDGPATAELLGRWFGLPARRGHTPAGAPLAVVLAGLEACSATYVLQVDVDLLIGRLDRAHDPLRELVGVLEDDPLALTASLNILRGEDRAWTREDDLGNWRVESRGALFHLHRLRAGRPWPNEQVGEHLALAWHRSLDQGLSTRGLRSYRGGDRRSFFIHPPNTRKQDRDEWLAILDRVEAGLVPRLQRGSVELTGSLGDWLGPRRDERVVVIACGRDVPPGRVLRWWTSLQRQDFKHWGAVVVDDGGSPTTRSFLRQTFEPFRDRVTLLTLRARRGGLANTVWSLRHLCTNPDTIVSLVDLDDALLGSGALSRIVTAHERGADVTVGSMLRLDRWTAYPTHLDAPRLHRGGNVWQHARSFRRRLFDQIPDEHLRLDGRYVELAWDWALMVPLVERARHPVHILDPLYLHEPSGEGKSGASREVRERNIERILSKASLEGEGDRG